MPREDVNNAIRQLLDSGLAMPPVPTKFVRRFRAIGPWHWGSRTLHPLSMYMFEHFASEDERVTVPPDYVSLCHAGHGINSYALTYHLVYRPIAILFQIAWGGVYMDGAATVERFNRQCELAEGVVDLADRVRSGRGSGNELGLLLLTDLRERADFQIINEGGHAHEPQRLLGHDTFDEDAVRVCGEASTWLTAQL